jgi:hypothetical protein
MLVYRSLASQVALDSATYHFIRRLVEDSLRWIREEKRTQAAWTEIFLDKRFFAVGKGSQTLQIPQFVSSGLQQKTIQTYIIRRQGAMRGDSVTELPQVSRTPSHLDFPKPSSTCFVNSGVLQPGHQYADIPVSNQSHMLKQLPLCISVSSSLWKCSKKFRTLTRIVGSDKGARKQKVTLLSCGTVQQWPVRDVQSDFRVAFISSGTSICSSTVKWVPYNVLQ